MKRLGVRPVGHRAVEGKLGTARQARPQLIQEKHAFGARHADAHAAHGLAAEVRLVEIEAHLGLGLLGQRLHEGRNEAARGVKRAFGAVGGSNAIEVKPARGKPQIDVESILPRHRRGAGHQLGLAHPLKRHRDIIELEAHGVAVELGLELDEGVFNHFTRMLGLGFGRMGQLAGIELELGRHIAVDARMSFEIENAPIDGIGVALLGAAHRGFETHPALGVDGARCKAQVLVGALPLRRPPEGERPFDRFGLELSVEPLELGKPDALGPMQRHHAVLDLDGLQRDVGGYERQRAWRNTQASPVAAALDIDGQAQNRLLQLDLVGLYDAFEQGRHGKPHGEAVGAEKRLAGGGRRIGDPDLVEAHEGRRQKAHVDVAAHAHLAAQNAGRLLLEYAAVSVPVDKVGNRKQRGERKRDEAGDVEKPVAH